MTKKISFQIQSKVDSIYPVERAILDLATEMGYDAEPCFCLRLAMDESLVNAIIHGNGNSEDKQIHVTAICDCDRIQVTVRDEGNGFDKSKLFDPRQEPYLHRTHGRGVFLIRQFTNEVRFNEQGNEITFCVERTGSLTLIESR